MSRRLLTVLFAFALALQAGEPATVPVLRLETGMHLGGITSITSDASGRLALTTSDDKTARLWDPATGQLLRTLRPPLGAGYEGQLFAGALSPDGRLAAVGGYTGFEWDGAVAISLFDTATGQCLRRITGLANTAAALAFSKDGLRLAAGLGKGGLRIFNLADGRELARDEDYGRSVMFCDFDPTGRLAVSCADDQVGLYDPQGRLLTKVSRPGGVKPHGLRFSPDGSRLAVGDRNDLRVEVLTVPGLLPLYTPDTKRESGHSTTVAWSRDGQTLYAAGAYEGDSSRPIHSWSDGGRGPFKVTEVGATNTIMALDPVGLLWASGEAGWGHMDRVAPRKGANAVFRGLHLGLDRTGARVRFAYELWGLSPWTFEVPGRLLNPGKGEGLSETLIEGLPVQGWPDSMAPTLAGLALPFGENERSRAVAIAQDKSRFLLGTTSALRCYDAQGKQLWACLNQSCIWSVNLSGDGRLCVAASEDGILHWHRMSDGRELLAFFPHNDQKRWVLWTPSGYYDCSPGAEELLGWHVNRGRDEAADFFPVARFRATYYRPDLISKVMETLDEGEALAALKQGARPPVAGIAALMPPVVSLQDPAPGASFAQGTVVVRALVRPTQGVGIDAVWAAVDGRRVELRGLKLQEAQGQGRAYTLDVPVPAADCVVSVFAQSGSAISEAASVRLAWAGAKPVDVQGFVIQPKLYVLAVGISAYRNPDFQLDYAAKDAKDFAGVMARQRGRLYREVEVKLLTDAEATRDGVLEGLEWLERQTTAKDVAVLFLAGHGINDEVGSYFYLPWNADLARVKSTLIPGTDFQSTLAKLPGKVVLFLDSCHSGNLLKTKLRGVSDPNRFINELSSAENGVVVFSASTGRQSSQESPEWGNGAFTKAVVEGMDGKADFRHTGRVTLNMLDLYISERVKELTRGTQAPTTAKPNSVQDYPIAISAAP